MVWPLQSNTEIPRWADRKTTRRPVKAFQPVDKELRAYVYYAPGITRLILNVMCGIGIIAFGWLLVMAFENMSKRKIGLLYLLSIFILIIFGEKLHGTALIVPIVYVLGCIHANMILSKLQASARDRLVEIEEAVNYDIDVALEKGILLHKVLGQRDAAAMAFIAASTMPGGKPTLLYQAGLAMKRMGHYREATAFFRRVAERAFDEMLITMANQCLKSVEKIY